MTSPTRPTNVLLVTSLLTALALAGCTDNGSTDNTTEDGGGTTDPDYGLQETWYLHETGPCSNDAPQEYFLSKSTDVDDADGCGTVGYTLAEGGGFTFTFPANEPSHGHDSGVPIEVEVYLQVSPPGAVTVEWALTGGGTIASGTIEEDTTGSTGYFRFHDQATTQRTIETGTNMTFEYTVVTSAGSIARGYGEGRTSQVLLG